MDGLASHWTWACPAEYKDNKTSCLFLVTFSISKGGPSVSNRKRKKMAGRVFVSSLVAMVMAASHASAFVVPVGLPGGIRSFVPSGLGQVADQFPGNRVPLNRQFQITDTIPGALTGTGGAALAGGAGSAWPTGVFTAGGLSMPAMGQQMVMGAGMAPGMMGDMGTGMMGGVGTGMMGGVGTGVMGNAGAGSFILTDMDTPYGGIDGGFITDGGLGMNMVGGLDGMTVVG